jgi:hypothetical protein
MGFEMSKSERCTPNSHKHIANSKYVIIQNIVVISHGAAKFHIEMLLFRDNTYKASPRQGQKDTRPRFSSFPKMSLSWSENKSPSVRGSRLGYGTQSAARGPYQTHIDGHEYTCRRIDSVPGCRLNQKRKSSKGFSYVSRSAQDGPRNIFLTSHICCGRYEKRPTRTSNQTVELDDFSGSETVWGNRAA